MKNYLKKIWPLLLPIPILTACNVKSTANPSTAITPNDTVAAIPCEIVYPDTSYASISKMKYEIDTLMDVSGELADLKNQYEGVNGIFTFRGSPTRETSFYGKVSGTPDTVKVDWVFTTAWGKSRWGESQWGGGSGWTGQPLYVNWTDEQVRMIKKLSSDSLTRDFSSREIMVGSLCGKIYFLNYETGKKTRREYDGLNPIKGTMSIDPSMNGNLYVGQGIPDTIPFGAYVYNLFESRKISFYKRDPKAKRGWGAYDSSPIAVGGFVFRPGENGIIYKLLTENGKVKVHSTLNYTVGGIAPGIESSMAVSRNYGYVADNVGNIIAVNLNNMRPVWMYNNGDDTDATIVVEVEDNVPYLYTGCEIDKQGEVGKCLFTKLNGLNGEVVWSSSIDGQCVTDIKKREGGMFATPLIGHGDCEGMIFSNFCIMKEKERGAFKAFDKNTGKVIYSTTLKEYSWSSPVALFNENKEMFIFTGDTKGYVYLIRGKNGEILFSKHIANNFESSPIVIDNTVVIGSRGKEIYRLSIE